MPAKKISELSEIQSAQLTSDDLLTVVDSSETDITNINKKLRLESLTSFLRDSSLFPIDFNSSYLNTAAFIQSGEEIIETPISNKVKGTLNLADYSAIKVDNYGRIYDVLEKAEITESNTLTIYAAGTAATFYKQKTGIVDGKPGPNQTEFPTTQEEFAGYFDSNTYYNPGTTETDSEGNVVADGYASLINLSSKPNNDLYWGTLLDRNYTGYSRVNVQLSYAYAGKDSTYKPNTGRGNIDIDWDNGKVSGTLNLPYYSGSLGAINFPFIFNNMEIPNDPATIVPLGQNYGGLLLSPKLLTVGSTRQIVGLPIPTIVEDSGGNIVNQTFAVNVLVKAYK